MAQASFRIFWKSVDIYFALKKTLDSVDTRTKYLSAYEIGRSISNLLSAKIK